MPKVLTSLGFVLLLSFFVFLLFLLLLFYNGCLVFSLVHVNLAHKAGCFVFDDITLVCLIMLCSCCFIVFPFVYHYMGAGDKGFSLFLLILGFAVVMFLLMLRGDYLTSLLF